MCQALFHNSVNDAITMCCVLVLKILQNKCLSNQVRNRTRNRNTCITILTSMPICPSIGSCVRKIALFPAIVCKGHNFKAQKNKENCCK